MVLVEVFVSLKFVSFGAQQTQFVRNRNLSNNRSWNLTSLAFVFCKIPSAFNLTVLHEISLHAQRRHSNDKK